MQLHRFRSRVLRFRKHHASWLRLLPVLIPLLVLFVMVPSKLFLPRNSSIHLPSHTAWFSSGAAQRSALFGGGGNPRYQLTTLQHDVRNVTRTMYRAYMNACMGRDEFVSATDQCLDWFGIGLTVLDSLDTLVLMDLKSEYEQSRQWAMRELTFANTTSPVSMFEIVIRALGGLNSAYELTHDSLWLNNSVQLGDMLIKSFNIRSMTCPPPAVFIGDDLDRRITTGFHSTASSPAEAGTLQLEFRSLSHYTGDSKYADAADACQNKLLSAIPDTGIVPDGFDLSKNQYYGSRLCIGGSVDSFYEMLIKNWIVWGKEDTEMKTTFENAVEGVFKTLSRKKGSHLYIGEQWLGISEPFRESMDHLACFFPGALAIAAMHGMGGGLHGQGANDYMPRARALTESCFAMTRGTKYGLAGEITDFSGHIPVPLDGEAKCYLRPEIVEALYYMDKLDPEAGDTYKEMGRVMWADMRKAAQVEGKPDGVMSSTFNLLTKTDSTYHDEKLNSFVIAETYKYFYLLFDERPAFEGPLPLDKWVYNTEAHPVRIVGRK